MFHLTELNGLGSSSDAATLLVDSYRWLPSVNLAHAANLLEYKTQGRNPSLHFAHMTATLDRLIYSTVFNPHVI